MIYETLLKEKLPFHCLAFWGELSTKIILGISPLREAYILILCFNLNYANACYLLKAKYCQLTDFLVTSYQ